MAHEAEDAARREAALRWVSAHGDALWRFALARTRSESTAEDIVQETLAAAIAGFDSFSRDSSELTWLLGIASHKVADHFRRRSRRDRPSSGHDEACACRACSPCFNDRGAWVRKPGAWAIDPSAAVEKREELTALRRCLDALPPSQGEVLWMREILGVPTSELCSAMGLTATNLWTRLHRARLALRACIEAAISSAGDGTQR
jgi:RNA polymerase sigma-70 factor (ECF subfamily)